MGKKNKVKKEKDIYENLSQEWRSAVESGTEEEIRARISTVAIENQILIEAKKLDEDYQKAKSALSVAGAVYKETAADNKLKIKFAHSVLKSRGRSE